MTSSLFSFVAASRNDDHGGDVLRRTQSFVRSLASQAARHRVRCELILVDWNPPAGRARLTDVLAWPEGSPWFSAKVVTVSPEIHRALPNSRSLSMFQMIAKNAGIRRASGDFIVATNIDIIFSDALFRWLKGAPLSEEALYRSDRWDVPNDVQLEGDIDRLLERAHDEAIRKNRADGVWKRVADEWIAPDSTPFDDAVVNPLRGALAAVAERARDRSPVGEELDSILNVLLPDLRDFYLAPELHTHACGDFTMLSKAGWATIRGYPEWPVFSWNLDSIALYQAWFSGIRESVAPADAVHYHIEHDLGSGYSPDDASLWSRLKTQGIPFIEFEDYRGIVLEMKQDQAQARLPEFNDGDWGFADKPLPVVAIALSESHAMPAGARNELPLVEGFVADDLHATGLDPFAAVLGPACQSELGWFDGAPWLSLRSAAVPWTPLLEWALPPGCFGIPCWVICHVRVRSGRLIVRLNRSRDRTVAHETCALEPGGKAVQVIIPLSAIDEPVGLTFQDFGSASTSFDVSVPTLYCEQTKPAALEIAHV